MTVKVSVIVPVYNLGPMVDECLQGLRDQETPFGAEFIVLDDASPDDSWQRVNAAARGDSRFRLLRNSGNRGLAYNQRELLRQARGRYIAYMDGDDIALPGKLVAMSNYLDEHSHCGLVYHEAEIFDHESGEGTGYYSRDHYNAAYIPPVSSIEHLVRYGCYLNASSVMYRRHDHIDDVVDERCQILLDYPMHIMNAGHTGGTVDRIDTVLGRYRIHANSSCAQNARAEARRIQVLEDQLTAVENASRFGVEEAVIAAGRAHHHFATALFFLKQGRIRLFQEQICAASAEGHFFDERHRYAYTHRDVPDRVYEALFGVGA